MPAESIDRIHALARRSNAACTLIFADRHGNLSVDPEDDDLDDESFHPDDVDYDEDDDLVYMTTTNPIFPLQKCMMQKQKQKTPMM
eukprot:scaffold37028_cov57-Attheya_sp.AAC.4